MISRTFGAPLGGTTDGCQYGLESLAFSLITPPNFGGSGGSCLPSIVVVALGEPGVPSICWAWAVKVASGSSRKAVNNRQRPIERFVFDKYVMCRLQVRDSCSGTNARRDLPWVL